jgi:hypothetical protein
MRNKTQMLCRALGLLIVVSACGENAENQRLGGFPATDTKGEADAVMEPKAVELPQEVVEEPILEEPIVEEVVAYEVLVVEIETKVGARNFEQINHTFAALTGVSPAEPQVKAAFLELKSQLPGANDVKSLSPAQISSITKLSANYCDVLVRDDALRGQAFGNFDFSRQLNSAFSVTAKDNLARALIGNFWGEELETLPDITENVAIISQLLTDMAQGKNNDTQATSAVAMGACTAVLASAPVILF